MSFYSKHKRYLEDRCLLNFKLKSSILLAGVISISLQAQDYEVEDITLEQVKSEVLKTEVSEPANAQLSEQVSKPEPTQSEIMTADISEPEQTQSEVMTADASEPEQTQPEVMTAETSEPEQTQPEVMTAETSEPEQTQPEVMTAETSEPEQTQPEVMTAYASEPEQTQSEVMEAEILELETAQMSDQVSEPMSIPETRGPTCPVDFYTLPLYPNAKFCQLFAEELPASMSYFAISDQESAKAFYLDQLGQAEDEQMLKGRIVLQYGNGQQVVVISKDGQGSQIDILIKSAG
jgi:hypothetical protein